MVFGYEDIFWIIPDQTGMKVQDCNLKGMISLRSLDLQGDILCMH